MMAGGHRLMPGSSVSGAQCISPERKEEKNKLEKGNPATEASTIATRAICSRHPCQISSERSLIN